MVDEIAASGSLDQYHLFHSTRGDLLRRLNRPAESVESYQRALALTQNSAERRFLQSRLKPRP